MLEANMTQPDWDKYLAEWSRSFNLAPQPVKKATSKPEFKAKSKFTSETDGDIYPYLYKMKETHKAIFFLTDEGIGGQFGFWIPKSAIVSDTGKKVKIQTWCSVKTIQYEAY